MNNNEIVPGFDDEKDDSLKIQLKRIHELPNCLALFLVGYIDTENSNNFQRRVARAIEAGFTKLIFERSGLNIVSDTDIGCFTAFLKALKPRGGDLVMVDMPPKVYEVYQLLGFSNFFHIVDTIEEAISILAQKPKDRLNINMTVAKGASSRLPKWIRRPPMSWISRITTRIKEKDSSGLMYEIRKVRQNKGEPFRRWFFSKDLDLVVWYKEDSVYGFQLCYDVQGDEHALTWYIDKGFLHSKVDEGDTVPGKAKTAILLPNGVFDNVGIANHFRKASRRIDPIVRELVYRILMEYPR